jgi:hypothetical protein
MKAIFVLVLSLVLILSLVSAQRQQQSRRPTNQNQAQPQPQPQPQPDKIPTINWGKCPQLEPKESEKTTKATILESCLKLNPIPKNLTETTIELRNY